jgi:hypothetical protein
MHEVKIGTPLEIIAWLTYQPEKRYKIEEYFEKRSNNANSYAWVLISQIAERMNPPLSKEAVYLQMLKDYGQSEIFSILSGIDVKGYFKCYEPCGVGHVEGKEFTHYKVWKGSSEYDKREMSILIDGIVQEARALDIETIPPDELERLKNGWGE